MRFSKALKYQLNTFKWPVIIYYILMYALYILFAIMWFNMQRHGVRGSIGGLDGATPIFLFVAGLVSYKATFHMFVGHGLSRRTMFLSFVAASGLVCLGMAVLDTINVIVMSSISNYRPVLLQLFSFRYASLNVGFFADNFLWMFCINIAAVMAGYLVTSAYYRMGKTLKLLVSIGVPVFFLIALPIMDAEWFGGAVYTAIFNCIAFCSGIKPGIPYIGMLSSAVLACLLGGLTWLLQRRATVRM